MTFSNYILKDNVYVNKDSAIENEFEEKYIALRKNENRVYSDEELRFLPDVAKHHQLYKEWILRKQSAQRLFNYLTKKNKALKILEVGCGNGWFSNYLSRLKNSFVVGLDINFTELRQAANVFTKNNLIFMYDVLSEKLLLEFNFDIIVFAASAQYFSSIQKVIKMALPLLNKEGEIHILDTNFYRTDKVASAKKRTQEYYTAIGFADFSVYYHHHSLNELNGFCVDKLYNTSSVKNIFSKYRNPFPWFRVKEKTA